MIPKIIHQIWIGPKPCPDWTHKWRLPGWGYRLWTDDDFLSLDNRELYERYVQDHCWNGAANVARVEILLSEGGVYIDADTEFVTPLDEASFMGEDLFVLKSPNDKQRLTNAVMGATPNHPAIANYKKKLSEVRDVIHPSWQKTGALLMADAFRGFNVEKLHPGTFFERDMRNRPVAYDGTRYGKHLYGTTRKLYES